MQNQEWKPRAIGLPHRMRPDWPPYAFAIVAGIAVAVILSLAGMWLESREISSCPGPLYFDGSREPLARTIGSRLASMINGR
jgi:hypothetical protein